MRRAAVLLLALFAGCWTPRAEPIPETEGPYDRLPDAARPAFVEARAALEAGDAETAGRLLAPLAEAHPDNVVIGSWLQEAEIAAAHARPADEREAAIDLVRRTWRERAERDPSGAHLVLAARVEPDPLAAGILLERAAELDPACAWVPYGQAFLAAQGSRWAEVKERLARAIELDPGHMQARWLSAWMLARGGGVREAIGALDAWIEKARGDPRLDTRLLLEAELDLALLSVENGDPGHARALLAELESTEIDQGRRWSAIASAEQALGDPGAALRAATEAEALAPGDLLPLVQQALLYDTAIGDPAAAEAAWTRVLAVSRSSPDLAALLERVRARVRLERFQEAREASPRARETPGRS